MTTNPTPPTEPLSADLAETATVIYACTQLRDCDDDSIKLDIEMQLEEFAQRYAAQQTAELTACIAALVEALKTDPTQFPAMEAAAIDVATKHDLDPILVLEMVEQVNSASFKDALTNLPAAAQAHLDEVASLKAEVNVSNQVTIAANKRVHELKAENERLTQALADTVADVKLLRSHGQDLVNRMGLDEGWPYYSPPSESMEAFLEALAQTDKEAYR